VHGTSSARASATGAPRSGPVPTIRTASLGSNRAAARTTAAWFFGAVSRDTLSRPRERGARAGVKRSESKQNGTSWQATPKCSRTLVAVSALATHTARARVATNRSRL
jgi:hypothetical protein